jgi:HEAT repeat protein
MKVVFNIIFFAIFCAGFFSLQAQASDKHSAPEKADSAASEVVEEKSAVEIEANSKKRKGEKDIAQKGLEQLKLEQDLQNLTNDNPLFYEKAMFAFEQRGASGITPLINYLKDNKNDKQIILAVLYTFGRVGEGAARAVPIISEFIRNGDKDIRATAISALGKIGRAAESAIPDIKDKLFDHNPWVANIAYRALVEMNTDKSKKIAKDYKKSEMLKEKRKELEEQSK